MEQEVKGVGVETLDKCLDHYQRFSICGERFGEILEREPY